MAKARRASAALPLIASAVYVPLDSANWCNSTATRTTGSKAAARGQDRLTSELRLAQAANLASANAVLRKFIADYNCRFARMPREMETAWRLAPESLDRICCFVHERTVSNDNVVQWEGRRFQIPQQARRFSFASAKVQIYQALDGRVSFYYGETRLEHAAIPGG